MKAIGFQLILFICFVTSLCFSQQFIDRWTEAHFNAFSADTITRLYKLDHIPVIINNHEFHGILRSDSMEGGGWIYTGQYIREAGGQVFSFWFPQEVLLYDFNAQVGDRFAMENDSLIVTNVDTIIVENGTPKRRITLECIALAMPPIHWLEGIGSTDGITTPPCVFDWYGDLLCAYSNGEWIFNNPDYETCWLTVSNEELSKNHISIFPNPFSETITIEDPDKSIVELVLYDLPGQVLYKGDDHSLDTKHLFPGTYIIRTILKNGIAVSTMLIKT